MMKHPINPAFLFQNNFSNANVKYINFLLMSPSCFLLIKLLSIEKLSECSEQFILMSVLFWNQYEDYTSNPSKVQMLLLSAFRITFINLDSFILFNNPLSIWKTAPSKKANFCFNTESTQDNRNRSHTQCMEQGYMLKIMPLA